MRRLWFAQLVSIFGDFLAVFAVFAIVTFQLHGTATQVAMILVAYLLPLAVISPLAGVFVDKWNVKWTMIASDTIRGVLVLALLFEHDLYMIYGTFLLLSTVSAFFMPAQSVAVRTLAPPNGLMAVNALMTQAVQGSQIVSPAIAGLLVQGLGANSCFIFDSLSFFFSAGMVLSLTIHRESAPASTAARSVVHSLSEGFRFIFTHSAISFVMLSMTAGMFAVRCFGALLSVYVRDILRSNAALFGTLNSLIGVGMIVGSQCVHRFAQKISRQHLVIYGLGGMGVAVLFTALFGTVVTTAAGHARTGLLCGVYHDHRADADSAGDAGAHARPREQQPDVADGNLTGVRNVRRRSGGGAGRHPQSVLRQRRDAGDDWPVRLRAAEKRGLGVGVGAPVCPIPPRPVRATGGLAIRPLRCE